MAEESKRIAYTGDAISVFVDCVGAIDGTHVQASVPIKIQGKFRGRKDDTTQNVLAAITFDLKFSYVLAGWEGSARDSRVLNDALSRRDGLKIAEGKYYLGDAGYGIQNGVISSYHSVRYHLKEYDDNPPTNAKELFNLRHSTLRTTIERGFGILKKRFRAIDAKPQWSYATQVDVVLASCILHNFIMGVAPRDFISDSVRIPSGPRAILSQREEREENREWSSKRDMIASYMWN
ncbi:Nuclease HARBI [Heracleum sosnowskyi]|uniref:Nuclease HARBI n=1 Tax=Heracleum sosnowskyi TaxID=360622 RepID=A0AAD8I1E2_9APIA|nr:Nuclease HARBI [Heracleum sosnowskyi]